MVYMGQIKVEKIHKICLGMTKMDHTSQNQKNIRPKWVKKEGQRSDQVGTTTSNRSGGGIKSKKSRKRERDRATTEQPDQTSSNEMRWTWQKLTNVGGPRYRKTAVTLTDCECPACPPIIKSLCAQQKMNTGGKMKIQEEKSCGAGKVRGEAE
jgi:hypothetical protein